MSRTAHAGFRLDSTSRSLLEQAEAHYRKGEYAAAGPLMLFLAAAEVPVGCFYLGRMYETGRGVPQDFARAAELYTRAADAGIGEAHNNLGWLFLRGEGVKRDEARAVAHFKDAAFARSFGGADALTMVYVRGGAETRPDPVEAVAWNRLAIALGSPVALAVRDTLSRQLDDNQLAVAAAYLWHLTRMLEAA